MIPLTALVQPFSRIRQLDRRSRQRVKGDQEALTRPLDADPTLAWGAIVREISDAGVGLALCYPFRTGTLLSVELVDAGGTPRSYVTRVVHARDQADGTWHVGCEFVAENQ